MKFSLLIALAALTTVMGVASWIQFEREWPVRYAPHGYDRYFPGSAPYYSPANFPNIDRDVGAKE